MARDLKHRWGLRGMFSPFTFLLGLFGLCRCSFVNAGQTLCVDRILKSQGSGLNSGCLWRLGRKEGKLVEATMMLLKP